MTDRLAPDSPEGIALAAEIRILASHIAAAEAELAAKIAEFDRREGWAGWGIRSVAHWLSIDCGFELRRAAKLAATGAAMSDLTVLHDAWSAGELSSDKARQLATVAEPGDAEDQQAWLEMAQAASGSQLARICAGVRRVRRLEQPDTAKAQAARRGLWSFTDDEGMGHLNALLTPEEVAVVRQALRALTGGRPVEDPEHPADDRFAAARADALVAMARHSLSTPPEEHTNDPSSRCVIINLPLPDSGTPQQPATPALFDGDPVSQAVAERYLCGGDIFRQYWSQGLPVDSSPTSRFPNRRLRRAAQARDRFCTYPGCSVPAIRCETHHLVPVHPDGGPTTLWNLDCKCAWHHQRHHDGAFTVERLPDGRLLHRRPDGSEIRIPDPPRLDPVERGAPHLEQRRCLTDIDDEALRAGDGGAPADLRFAIDTIVANHHLHQQRQRSHSPPHEPVRS